MTWALSYIGANFALVLVVAFAVLALAAVAWFAKNWKVAVAALAILVAGLAYQQIDHNAYNHAQAEQKAREFRVLQDRLGALLTISAADEQRAKAAEATIDALRSQARDTPANNKPCLPKDAAKRVGGIK